MYLFAFFLLVQYSFAAPYHIFDTHANLCNYGDKKIPLTDKIWSVTNKNYEVHFSFCKPLQNKCKSNTVSCLIKKRERNKIITFGESFKFDDQNALTSSGGSSCMEDTSLNYTLKINFECSDSTNTVPRLAAYESDCIYQINMMAPGCTPKCTGSVLTGQLIDLRKFPKNVHVQSEDKNFNLNICGSNNVCGNGVTTCEILSNNSTVPISSQDNQFVRYDNKLFIKGFARVKNVRRDLEVLLKCNWEKSVFNATYKKPQQQGRKYRFELESSYGCVKTPQNCFIFDKESNVQYNLSGLYRDKYWEVSKVPKGKIVLSICGPLTLQQKNKCTEQFSQVCDIQQNINRGSILTKLEAYKNEIQAVFESGGTCSEKPWLSYSTEITFQCSLKENGPTYQTYKDCVTHLFWETPQACSFNRYVGANCQVSDTWGSRTIHNSNNNEGLQQLLPNSSATLEYSFCKPLTKPCNGFKNANICLKVKNQEKVIGFDNNNLISDNGLLRLDFEGEKCNTGDKSTMVVNFICNYDDKQKPKLITIKDNCKYNLTIPTRSACLSDEKDEFNDCVYNDDRFCYDLNPLVLKNRNYNVQDPDNKNIQYILNICGPTITQPNALCPPHSMICLKNNSEIIFKKRYQSLGSISTPKMINGTLVTNSLGMLNDDLVNYKTVIKFQCSQTEEMPKLESKNNSFYTFNWKTKHACKKNKKCFITTKEKTINLVEIKQKNFNVSANNTTYKFNFCEDVYLECLSNGTCSEKNLVRSLTDSSTIEFDLQQNNSCSEGNVNKIISETSCDAVENNEHVEHISFENCSVKMKLKSHTFCTQIRDTEIAPLSDEKITKSTMSVPKEFHYKFLHNNILNCSIGKLGNQLNLSEIHSPQIIDGYSINFDGNLDCNGFICKNTDAIVPFFSSCPLAHLNYTGLFISLQFPSVTTNCKARDLQVRLMCRTNNGTNFNQHKLFKKDECNLIFELNVPKSCELLKQNLNSNNAKSDKGLIIWSFIGVIALLIFGLISFYVIKKKRLFLYQRVSSRSLLFSKPTYIKVIMEKET